MNALRASTVAPLIAAAALTTASEAAHAVPQAHAARSQPPLVTGRGDGAKWRLEGRRLTVKLRKPFRAIKAGDRRILLRATCGDVLFSKVDSAWPSGYAISAGGRIRVRPRTRVIRMRLGRNVTRRVTGCALGVDTGYGMVEQLTASWMTLRRGVSPGCSTAKGETVVAWSDEALVTVQHWTDRVPRGYIASGGDLYRGCLRDGGRLRALGYSWASRYGSYGTLGLTAAAGTWIAWESFRRYSSERLRTVNLSEVTRQPGPGLPFDTIVVPVPVPDLPLVALVLAPTGAAAWIAQPGAATPQSNGKVVPLYDRLDARLRDGRVVTLDTGTPGSITSLAVTPDGAALTWRHDNVPRTAPLE